MHYTRSNKLRTVTARTNINKCDNINVSITRVTLVEQHLQPKGTAFGRALLTIEYCGLKESTGFIKLWTSI